MWINTLNTQKSNPGTPHLHFKKKEEVFTSGPGWSGAYLKAQSFCRACSNAGPPSVHLRRRRFLFICTCFRLIACDNKKSVTQKMLVPSFIPRQSYVWVASRGCLLPFVYLSWEGQTEEQLNQSEQVSHVVWKVTLTLTGWQGVDVMITNLCDFCKFSAKKLAFFSKSNVMIKCLQKLAVVSAKRPIFSPNVLAKIFLKS
jgi:hypothetical protein